MNRLGSESLLLAATLAEIRRRLGVDADDLLRSVGRRIGAACAGPPSDDLAAVQAWMTDIWTTLDMGGVELSGEGAILRLTHRLPSPSLERRQWSDMLPSVIEGVYEDWLARLDGRGQLVLRSSDEQGLEFTYGV